MYVKSAIDTLISQYKDSPLLIFYADIFNSLIFACINTISAFHWVEGKQQKLDSNYISVAFGFRILISWISYKYSNKRPQIRIAYLSGLVTDL
jgi:hypothetical protein